jgi:hypothetical protein
MGLHTVFKHLKKGSREDAEICVVFYPKGYHFTPPPFSVVETGAIAICPDSCVCASQPLEPTSISLVCRLTLAALHQCFPDSSEGGLTHPGGVELNSSLLVYLAHKAGAALHDHPSDIDDTVPLLHLIHRAAHQLLASHTVDPRPAATVTDDVSCTTLSDSAR